MTEYLRFVCFYSKLIIKTSLAYNCNSIVTMWKSVPSNDAFAYVGIVGNLFYVANLLDTELKIVLMIQLPLPVT